MKYFPLICKERGATLPVSTNHSNLMETFFYIVLIVHIAAGFTALSTGFVPFVTVKGGKIHKTTGKIFYYAMLTVAASAFVLSILHFNPFLFIVGLLTGYATYTGYQGLIWMRTQRKLGTKKDWLFLDVFGLVLLGFLLVVPGWLFPDHTGFLSVMITFTCILLFFVVKDVRIFSGHKVMKERNSWIVYHIGRISGAYIAALTAFLVVNVQTDPVFIAWLLPAAIGVPAIFYFQHQYKKKKGSPVTKPTLQKQTI